ncbi:YCF48-related protein [Aliiglaciecola sp. CAU 1673]|uniref:WD40/YVTN/BNR-like repeat-containing protein n=1 Tax=Aliiglaciecola sp. CAU 1673 TaxID=3032595 RepID=UPI0023DC54A4|nr:YCF48-related protein [Aliiglaciecola sp. CAU 1673]MDF2177529.1 YCF48-related protein [Aliiglaciecola sp. CAU 1673]
MKKILVPLTLVISMATQISLAQDDNQTDSKPLHQAFMAPLAEQSLLLDISQSDLGYFLVVGERGHILRSEDGQSWQQVHVPTQATLTAVFSVGEESWAVGHDAVILHSQDSGKTWQVQSFSPELEKPLLDVHFFNKQQGIAIGAYGLLYRTENGGEQWVVEPHPELLGEDDIAYLEELRAEDPELYEQELSGILPHFNRVSADGDRLYLAGEAGLLAYSDDQGKQWHAMDVDYFGSFFDIKRTLTGRLLAAGLRGHLFEYFEDDGWVQIETGMKASFNSIISFNDRQTLVVGNNGRLLWLGEEAELLHTDDEKAIIAGLTVNGQVVAVSEVGIKVIKK